MFYLPKRLDSVSHALLLHKLKLLGFSGQLLACFKDYLNDRKQRVVALVLSRSLLVCLKDLYYVRYSFYIFIKDISTSVELSTVAMFADGAK